VNTTFIGEHSFDHRLPDFSAASIEALASDIVRLLDEAATLHEATLSPVERMMHWIRPCAAIVDSSGAFVII